MVKLLPQSAFDSRNDQASIAKQFYQRVIFNSYIFWVFFAVVMLLYRILPHRAQNRILLVASYFFYGC